MFTFNQQQPTTSSSSNNKTTTTDGGLVRKLKRIGVSRETIDELLAKYPTERIRRQLEMLPYRQTYNPAGFLVRAIKGDWSAPKPYLDAKTPQGKQTQQNTTIEAQRARQEAEHARGEQRMERLKAKAEHLSASERNALRQQAERRVRQSLGKSWPLRKPVPKTLLEAEFDYLLEARISQTKPANGSETEGLETIGVIE